MVAHVEQVRGSLLGLALGDALGAPYESRPVQTVRQRLPNVARLLHEPATRALEYTDDTQMMIAVAEALLADREPTPEAYAERFVANYEPWRGYGRGARAVLASLQRGDPVERAARIAFPEGSWGNGAAMRVAAVGLRFAAEPPRRREHAYRSALPTHCHPVAVSGATLLAHAVALALRTAGRPFDAGAWWDALEPWAEHSEYVTRMAKARTVEAPDGLLELGNGVAAVESVVTAIACFCAYADDFVYAVGEAVRLGGDCDTIAAMAGALAGARLGAGAIPQVWLERLENGDKGRDYIDGLARRLASAGSEPRP